MSATWKEYQSWEKDEAQLQIVKPLHDKAHEMTEQRRPFENKLKEVKAGAPTPKQLLTFVSYLQFEIKAGDQARITNLYERAVQECCNTESMWHDYLNWLVRIYNGTC